MELQNCPDVRLAELADLPELMRLTKIACSEDAQHSYDAEKVVGVLRLHFEKRGGVVGVIGEPGKELKAYIIMVINEVWYSRDHHVQELSLFVDPDQPSIQEASDLGADVVELHTGDYCEAKGHHDPEVQLARLGTAAEHAIGYGLKVAAGHGLDYPNVAKVAGIPGVEELNIGHAIVARAVLTGLEKAVRDMIFCIREGVFMI